MYKKKKRVRVDTEKLLKLAASLESDTSEPAAMNPRRIAKKRR